MARQTVALLAGQTLTITADANSFGTVCRLADSAGGEPYAPVSVAASATLAVGPFVLNRQYAIDSAVGALTYTALVVEPVDSEPSDVEALSSNLTTIPANRSLTVGANTQLPIFSRLTIAGILTVAGELRVGPWPI